METVTIHFRNKFIVAHEVVFPEKLSRNLVESFRFVLKSWVYHKDMSMLNLDHHMNKRVSYQLRSTTSNTRSRSINYELAKIACTFFETDFLFICHIAAVFKKHPEYNGICFSDDGSVIFIKAFKHNYGE